MTASRRRFLGIAGVAMVGNLAGCRDDSTAGTDTTTRTAADTGDRTSTTTPLETDIDDQTLTTAPTASHTPSNTSPGSITSTRPAKLAPDDGDAGDFFGWSVGLSGDGTTVLVGAHQDEDPNGENAGSAYVFSRSGDTWRQQTKLAPADGDPDDHFGTSVDVSGDGTIALVGAVADEDPNGDSAGSTYVFSRSGGTWSQQTKLTPDDGDPGDGFGGTVGVSGDGTITLVGAPGDEDPNGEMAGSAYVFSRSGDTWSQQTKLTPDDGEGLFSISIDLSLDGTTALVGTLAENAGTVYVFSRSGDTWRQQTKLTPDDGDSEGLFGISVGVSGDGTTALVGNNTDEDPNGEMAGSAYVFSRSGGTWSQQVKLAPDDGDAGDAFGTSVDVSGDGTTALVGAVADEDPNGENAGSAYVFSRSGDTWRQQTKLAPEDGDPGDGFGAPGRLSRDGTTALVAADRDEDPNGAGAAYVFEL